MNQSLNKSQDKAIFIVEGLRGISTMGGDEEEKVMEERVIEISIKDLSRKLEEFAKARDWEKYHSPRNLLLAMVNLT